VRSAWSKLVGALEPYAFVLDLRSRAAEGLAVLRRLRRNSTPILVLAADPAVQEVALDLGAVALLEPIDPADTIAVLLDLVTTEALVRAERAGASELLDDARALGVWERV
jgi:DNA-binding response OmpR family regulator